MNPTLSTILVGSVFCRFVAGAIGGCVLLFIDPDLRKYPYHTVADIISAAVAAWAIWGKLS